MYNTKKTVVQAETLCRPVGLYHGVALRCCTLHGLWGRWRRLLCGGFSPRWRDDRHCRLVVDAACGNGGKGDDTDGSSRRITWDNPTTVNDVSAQDSQVASPHTHGDLLPRVGNTRARTVHKHVLAANHGAVWIHRHEAGEGVLHPNVLQLQRQIAMP